ncbi:MAG: SpoIIE family protein phosphatase [Blastocatellia bacterium]|nr:SpoIIE family protein phosphatase [Blastocatellia bacterium]
MASRILIADDQPDVLAALRLLLKGDGFEAESVNSPEALVEAVTARDFDAILMDLNYARDTTSGQEGLDLIGRIRSLDGAIPVIAMTAWGSIELAVEAMRRGLNDFILKPWDNARLIQVLNEQIADGRIRRREARLQTARERELVAAREIQQGLLPRDIPVISGCRIATAWQPAREVSGDYFDVLAFDAGRAAICIADVMGKGMAAALLMSNLQALVKAYAGAFVEPAELCAQINRMMCAQNSAGRFVTFFYALYDVESRRLQYVNAGHNPPFLLRPDGRVLELTEGGAVLGVFETGEYRQGVVALERGDRLVLFTDGITEAANIAGDEFGEARLLALLNSSPTADVDALREIIMRAVNDFAGGSLQDDATMIALRCE